MTNKYQPFIGQDIYQSPEVYENGYQLNIDKQVYQKCVEEDAKWQEKILFKWTNRLMKLRKKEQIEQQDIYDLRKQDKYKQLMSRIREIIQEYQNKQEPISLFKVIWRLAKSDFYIVLLLQFIGVIIQFIGPFSIKNIIRYLNDQTGQVNAGDSYIWALGMLLAYILYAVVAIHFQHINQKVVYKFVFITEGLIIEKSLRLSTAARRYLDAGKIISLMSGDVDSLDFFFSYATFGMVSPVLLIFSLIYTITEIGVIGLICPVVMLISFGILGLIQILNNKYKHSSLELMDRRSKLVSECIYGIRILKYYAWEYIFQNRIFQNRDQEGNLLLSLQKITSYMTAIFDVTPVIISILVFSLYVKSGQTMTAETTFTILTLFNLFQYPLRGFIMTAFTFTQAKTSFKRLNHFINSEEKSQKILMSISNNSMNNSIQLDNVISSWDSQKSFEHALTVRQSKLFMKKPQKKQIRNVYQQDSLYDQMEPLKPVFENLYMRIQQNKFIGIVGQVGSGKTSLLLTILGELEIIKGKVQIDSGKVAYVPQQAWLRNATIRENICFGEQYIKEKYQRILSICELNQDMESLPQGDLTEVGEKGINLSGGQKQRISIARALYSEADIYLFDDCMSALDMHVGPNIFQNAFKLYLHNKTRILVTHALQFLNQFDEIIIINSGKITEQGTFQQLIESNSSQLKQVMSGDNLRKYQNFQGTQTPQHQQVQYQQQQLEPQQQIEQEQEANDFAQVSLNQAEKQVKGGVPMRVYKEYFFGQGKVLGIVTISLFFLAQSSRILSDWWLGMWSVNAFNKQTEFYIYFYSVFALFALIVTLLRGKYFGKLATESSIQMFKRMLSSLLRTPLWWYDITPVGRILNRCTKDQDEVDFELPSIMLFSFIQSVHVITTCILIIIITPLFLILFSLMAFGYIIIIKYYLQISVELKRLLVSNRSPFYAVFTEILNGTTVIRAFKKENMFLDIVASRADNYHCYMYNLDAVNVWMVLRTNIFGAFIIAGSGFFGILSKDINYTSNPALIGLSLTWSLTVIFMLSWAIKMLGDTEIQMSGVQRILEYAENNPQEHDFNNPKAPSNWPTNGTIIAKNIYYRYRPELPPVIKGIDFQINSGEKIGVCGRTGSGKSTLTLGLLRILEIDHTNEFTQRYISIDGQVIEKFGLHELRQHITIIPQDPLLFSGTISFNVDPYQQYSSDQIILALQKCQIWNSLQGNTQQDKLNFLVEEGGQNFSQGERQLICLARALIRKTKILLMDEATASIDEKTDQILQNMIKNEFQNCTILTIAHRLNSIINCDRIMVLSDGLLTEFDTPHTLLSNTNSEFYKLVHSQGKEYADSLIGLTHKYNHIYT